MKYAEKFNTGLPFNFSLTNGKFDLIGGEKKVDDNLKFFMGFDGFFRVYLEDFPPNFTYLVQKPIAFLNEFRTLILGATSLKIKKYLVFLIADKFNILYEPALDRKSYEFAIQYRYSLNPEQSIVMIKEIKV